MHRTPSTQKRPFASIVLVPSDATREENMLAATFPHINIRAVRKVVRKERTKGTLILDSESHSVNRSSIGVGILISTFVSFAF
jgi:hypothetical protein